MRAAHRHWPDAEVERVRDLSPTHTAVQIAEIIGRTAEQVRGCVKRHGISMGQKGCFNWTPPPITTGTMRPEATPYVLRFLRAGWDAPIIGYLFDIDPAEIKKVA